MIINYNVFSAWKESKHCRKLYLNSNMKVIESDDTECLKYKPLKLVFL